MAEWAFYVIIVSGCSVVVTGIGVVYVALTLRATRDAVEETRKGTAAAQEMVYAERAWMSFVKTMTDILEHYKAANRFIARGIGVSLHFVNTGRSPAIDVYMCTLYEIIDFGSQIPAFEPDAPDVVKLARGPVGPDISIPSEVIYLDESQVMELANRQKQLIVYCKIEYRDIFLQSVTRHTETCGRFVIDSSPHEVQAKGIIRSGFIAMGDQNTCS
jgi:hypothetical protein